MTSFRKFLAAALVTSALVLSACGSSTKSSGDTASTTTAATTTTAAATTTVVTTTAPATTVPPTTAASVVTNPPTTVAAPQIITNFSVSNPAACAAPDSTFVGPPPAVTISWTVTNAADEVQLLIDDGLWGTYGLSGSESLPAACDGGGHNVHKYSVRAMKNGSQIAKKSATRGY